MGVERGGQQAPATGDGPPPGGAATGEGAVGDTGRPSPWADALLAVVTAAIGGWVWVEASGFQRAEEPARDPAILPLALAWVLWACALGLLARVAWEAARRRGGTGAGPGPARAGGTALAHPTIAAPGQGWWAALPVALTIAGLLVYVWGAFEVGYAVATWLFLTAAASAMGGRRDARRVVFVALVSAACTAAIWFGFVQLLGVRLPATVAP